MKKHILIIQGGGRPKGNTAQLAAAFTQGTGPAGHTVETVSLLKNEVKGCLGRNACRYGRPCVQIGQAPKGGSQYAIYAV